MELILSDFPKPEVQKIFGKKMLNLGKFNKAMSKLIDLDQTRLDIFCSFDEDQNIDELAIINMNTYESLRFSSSDNFEEWIKETFLSMNSQGNYDGVRISLLSSSQSKSVSLSNGKEVLELLIDEQVEKALNKVNTFKIKSSTSSSSSSTVQEVSSSVGNLNDFGQIQEMLENKLKDSLETHSESSSTVKKFELTGGNIKNLNELKEIIEEELESTRQQVDNKDTKEEEVKQASADSIPVTRRKKGFFSFLKGLFPKKKRYVSKNK